MPSIFETYTADDIRAKLNELRTGQAGIEAKSSLAFLAGDYWQGNLAWVGPRPSIDHPNPGAFYEAIRKDLVSKNIAKEVVKRDRNGVIGREPNWTVTVERELAQDEKPTEQEQMLIDEAEAALLAWWDTRRYGKKVTLSTLQHSTDELNCSGRGLLRLCIPPAKIDLDGELVNAEKVHGNITAALHLLYFMQPAYEQAAVITDMDSQEQAGVFFIAKKQAGQDAAVFYDRIELVFLDDDGSTIIRIFDKDGKPTDAAPYNLGNRLTIYEMNRDPMISPQVKQMLKLFTMSATMRTRTVGQAGFPERTFIGVKQPSHMEPDPDKPGSQIEVKDSFKTGLGTTSFMQTQELEDADGNVRAFASGSLIYRDPVQVTTFDQTEKSAYNNILEEVSQIHVAITGDATSSGESRIQARADFVMALRETKTQVEAAGRWALETALAWAADLAGMPGRYAGLRVSFDCRLDAGPITAQERQLLQTEVEKRLRSREDAMTLLGVDDPTAMLQKIVAENDTLNPIDKVRAERAKIGLQADTEAAKGNPADIQQRLIDATAGATN